MKEKIIILAKNKKYYSQIIASSVLIVGIITTGLISYSSGVSVKKNNQSEFNLTTSEVVINIYRRMEMNAELLRSGRALFDASNNVTRTEWKTFVNNLEIDKFVPGIQGLGFSLIISPDQLANHIQQTRNDGFPDYTVKPEGDRKIYSSIIYLEPFTNRNLRAFGYDMLSESVRETAMSRARDTNNIALSGKVTLVQETNQEVQAGTLLYLPLYKKGYPLDTVEQRQNNILGWIYSPYRMGDLINGILKDSNNRLKDNNIFFRLYDSSVASNDTILFDSQDKESAKNTPVLSKSIPIDFGGQRWTLQFVQLNGGSYSESYNKVWTILIGGTLISILLYMILISKLGKHFEEKTLLDQFTIDSTN